MTRFLLSKPDWTLCAGLGSLRTRIYRKKRITGGQQVPRPRVSNYGKKLWRNIKPRSGGISLQVLQGKWQIYTPWRQTEAIPLIPLHVRYVPWRNYDFELLKKKWLWYLRSPFSYFPPIIREFRTVTFLFPHCFYVFHLGSSFEMDWEPFRKAGLDLSTGSAEG